MKILADFPKKTQTNSIPKYHLIPVGGAFRPVSTILVRLMRKIQMTCIVTAVLMLGCQSTYYAVWESLGKEKRHLLRDQIENVKQEQEDASEAFQDALTQIKEIYGFDGGDLEEMYGKLQADYENSRDRAEAVRNRVDKVDQIATDLFMEWEAEISEISSERLRSESAKTLKDTRVRYARLYKTMVKSRDSMDPVLQHLKDYVLYLKHNLNARAIGALAREVSDIEKEVKRLIGNMDRSIKEAEAFLNAFGE